MRYKIIKRSRDFIEWWDTDIVFNKNLPGWMYMPYWLERVLIPCWLFGHRPVLDMCGKPEHAFCLWCNKSTPKNAGWKEPNYGK